MKYSLLFLFASVAVTATAQTSTYSTTHSQINDDEKTLSIQIDGQRDGQSIAYNRSFDVRGMSKAQRDALKNRVLDSLKLGNTPPPPEPLKAPKPPRPAPSNDAQETVQFTCASCLGKSKLTISGNGISITQERDNGKLFPLKQQLAPGDYRYVYWQNGVLQMQLPFTVKAGEENVVNVK